ncbi:hypothetical protein C8R42DRAFT_638945 [Lentinula raphanica]|nr:hypothetical protein C8R42DRAFT_638945 [Lentinula raphanica]
MFAQNPQPTPTTIATASTPTAVTPVPPAPTQLRQSLQFLAIPAIFLLQYQSQPTPPVSSYMSPLRMRSAVSSRSIGGVSLSTQPSSSPFQSITAIECANNTRLDHAAQVLGNSSSTRRKKRGLGRKAPQLHGVAESAKVEDFFSVADVAWLDIPGQPFAILVRSPRASRHQLLRFTSKGNINNNAKTPRLTPAKVESEDMTLRQIVTNTNDYGIAKFAITNSNVDRLFHPSQALLASDAIPCDAFLISTFSPWKWQSIRRLLRPRSFRSASPSPKEGHILRSSVDRQRIVDLSVEYDSDGRNRDFVLMKDTEPKSEKEGYRNFNGDELDSGIDDEETNDDNNEEFGMLKAPAFTNSKKSKFDLGSKFGSGKLGFMDLGFSSDDLTASTTSNDASHASVPPPDAWNSSSKPDSQAKAIISRHLRPQMTPAMLPLLPQALGIRLRNLFKKFFSFFFSSCSSCSSCSCSSAPPAHVPGFSLPQGIVPDQVAPSKIGVFAIGTSGSVKRTTYGILGGSQKPEIVTKEGGGMIEQVSPKEIERSLKLFKPNDHRRLFILIPSAVGKTLLNSIHHPPNSTVCYRWKVGMSPDFERSRKEWDQQCPCEDRIRMNPIATTRRRRAESLAHLSLELECSERPKDYCRHCRRKHVEVFSSSDDWVYNWMNIVHPNFVRSSTA